MGCSLAYAAQLGKSLLRCSPEGWSAGARCCSLVDIWDSVVQGRLFFLGFLLEWTQTSHDGASHFGAVNEYERKQSTRKERDTGLVKYQNRTHVCISDYSKLHK